MRRLVLDQRSNLDGPAITVAFVREQQLAPAPDVTGPSGMEQSAEVAGGRSQLVRSERFRSPPETLASA
jgi:hypothetical protein